MHRLKIFKVTTKVPVRSPYDDEDAWDDEDYWCTEIEIIVAGKGYIDAKIKVLRAREQDEEEIDGIERMFDLTQQRAYERLSRHKVIDDDILKEIIEAPEE